MINRERYEKYVKIAERAEKSGFYYEERISLIMDIRSADEKFNIRLDEWLEADDFNFAHDIYGILSNIDRSKFPAINFGLFIPRFGTLGGKIMKAINIKWDVDNKNELENLPTEIIIPSKLKNENDTISDYLTDVTGFCHNGYELVEYR